MVFASAIFLWKGCDLLPDQSRLKVVGLAVPVKRLGDAVAFGAKQTILSILHIRKILLSSEVLSGLGGSLYGPLFIGFRHFLSSPK